MAKSARISFPRQRRVCPSRAFLPCEPITGVGTTLARSAAVFFGFLSSRFDLFCPFAKSFSNDVDASRLPCLRRAHHARAHCFFGRWRSQWRIDLQSEDGDSRR